MRGSAFILDKSLLSVAGAETDRADGKGLIVLTTFTTSAPIGIIRPFVASDIGFINSFAGSVELSIAVPNIFAEDPLHGQNAFAEIGGYELIGVYVTANSAI